MKKLRVLCLFILLLLIVGCDFNRNVEIFRFVNYENEIEIGETIYLQLLMGDYKEDAQVKYSVSTEGIVSIKDGFATGLNEGEVTIKATVDNVKFAYTKITVKKPAINGLKINATKKYEDNLLENTIYVDNEITLSTIIYPTTFNNEVTWSIEFGSDVAKIVDNVLIPLRGENSLAEYQNGGAKVRVVATAVEDGKTMAKRDFYIKYRPTEEIKLSLDKTTFEYDEIKLVTKLQLNVELKPYTNPNLTFTSSDPTIALVDASGVITFPEEVKAGTVTITVTSIDGVSSKIQITINEKVEEEPSEENSLNENFENNN